MSDQPDVQVEAQLTKMQTMADGSARLVFTTQEIRPEDFAKFYELLNQAGSVAFLSHKPSFQPSQEFNQ